MHTQFLQQALDLAQTQLGFCAPNPSVAALIVCEDQVIAEGVHKGPGTAHAEAVALQHAGKSARGATLYVTLEPCNHQGKTPPCTLAIINAGIKHVIYAFADPNPNVAGAGCETLLAAGIQCDQHSLPEIDLFYRYYRYWCATHKPWITAKLALSLDGKIAGPEGQALTLTGKAFQQYTHSQRRQADALFTTATTIKNDDPQFNVRLPEMSCPKPLFILDPDLVLAGAYQIDQTTTSITAFHNENCSPERVEAYQALGRDCIPLKAEQHILQFDQIFAIIGQRGMHYVWLEAGGHCLQHLLQQKALNCLLLAVAPKVIGSRATAAFTQAIDLTKQTQSQRWFQVGDDMICENQFQE